MASEIKQGLKMEIETVLNNKYGNKETDARKIARL